MPLKKYVKKFVNYTPRPDTIAVREFISELYGEQFAFDPSKGTETRLPYCTHAQGDLIYSLCKAVDAKNAIQLGFASGSTALYILEALGDSGERAVSIDLPDGFCNDFGEQNLQSYGVDHKHLLIKGDSALIMPDLVQKGQRFDIAFLDGWKTFDHLAVDMFYAMRLLNTGGCLILDDTHLPSVRKVIRMAQSHFAIKEVNYSEFGLGFRARLGCRLGVSSLFMPYRAFYVETAVDNMPSNKDWTFYRHF